jgi:plasmid stabilization system protein ParE
MRFKPGFDLHPGAAQDITEIWEFIAENSVLAARRVRVEIFDAIGVLVAFPHQGHKRPDLTARPLRFTTVRDYLIAHAPEEKPMVVIAVLHGRRNPGVLATILEDRHWGTG